MRGTVWIAVSIVCASFGLAAAGSALDKAPFAATPAELLAAAKGPATDQDIAVLREDYDVSFDDKGRMTQRWRLVFAVRTQAGADDWNELASGWRPFYQDKPVVRIRVIDASARAAELDPTQLVEEPVVTGTLPSDSRRLRATLPRLSVGAVVEELVTTTDRDVVPGGAFLTIPIADYGVPVASTRVRISAPAAMHLPLVARGLPSAVKPQRSTAHGRKTVTYSIGAVTPEKFEGWLPGDVSSRPYIAVSSAAGWQSGARALRALVDAAIARGRQPYPAELPKAATLEAVRKIVRWVQRSVRYNDVDLDSASYAPSSPAETVKRGIGTDLDVAVLLLGLLRDAGMRADLAVIDMGGGTDVDRDVPQLIGFDRVLVRVKLATDVWIDPVDADEIPGVLPSYNQARRALVIADDTTALTATPQLRGEDNLVREVRTFEASENGTSRVTEVSREAGIWESDQRHWIRSSKAANVRKNLVDYAKTTYGDAVLDRYSTTDVDDLAKPFEVTLVATHSHRVTTIRDQIDAYFFRSDTLIKLPDILGNPAADAKRRTHDMYLASAHVYEIEHRVVVPPGFTMPAPAPDKQRALGTMTLVEKQRIEGRTFIVTFRLDTGKPRLTPAEVAAIQEAVRTLRSEQGVHIVFENTAVALLDRGKVKEAIAEIERVAKLHPKEGIHHGELARAYLAAGAGLAARREARKAVALEPKVADHQVILGWVLTHDLIGRRFIGDFDRAGARAALERARVLDPKHVGAATELGYVLERDQRGKRFGRGADLAAAAAAYRASYALETDVEVGLNVTRTLLFGGKAADAEAFARKLPASANRDTLLLASTAAAHGTAEALRTAQTLATGSTRIERIGGAAGVLLFARYYDVARTLMKDAGLLPAGSAQEKTLTQLKRVDAPLTTSTKPEDIAVSTLVAQIAPGRSRASYWDAGVQRELETSSRRSLPQSQETAAEAMTDAFLEDVTRSMMVPKVDGDAKAWRVELEEAGVHVFMYLAADRGTPKVIGAADAPQGVGRHVLRLLAKNDEKTAARVLDWLDKDVAQALGAFHRVWGTNLPRTRQAMELAAAVLTNDTQLDRALPLFERCGATTTDGQAVCDFMATSAYRQRNEWDNLADYAEAWTKRSPKATRAIASRAVALAHLGKYDDADKLLADALAAQPDDTSLVGAQVEVSLLRNDGTEAIKRAAKLTSGTTVVPGFYNNLAWLRLALAVDLATALTEAQKAVQQNAKEASFLHTLASIEAELGNLADASKHVIESASAGKETVPSDATLYVHARILEQLGLAADAIAVYRRIKPSSHMSAIPDSNDLSARRLKALTTKH